MQRDPWRRYLGAVALAVGLSACGGEVTSTLPAGSSSGPPATANTWLEGAELARAITFRQTVGLRSDVEWVREVAARPEAMAGVLAYNVPLLPEEVEAVNKRFVDAQEVLDILDDYAANHPSEWAGATQDASGGSVTARFTAHVADHQANLRGWLPPNAKVNVVQVRWSLRDLRAALARMNEDDWYGPDSWLLEHGIYALGLGLNVARNQIEFDVSSTRTDLDALLEEQYGATQMLIVASDGTGVRLLPKGTLKGRVVNTAGEPVGGVDLELDASVPGAGAHNDVGHGTNDEGRFVFRDIEAVSYTVKVYTGGPIDTRTLLGESQRVTVLAGKTTTITITIP